MVQLPTKKLSPVCIGIVGSRRRATANDMVECAAALDLLLAELGNPPYSLVSGGCPKGADDFAEHLARARGLIITIHHADWEKEGRSAGFQRNTLIAQQCDILLALPAPDRTGGTEDTIAKAQRLGKRVVLVEKEAQHGS